MEPQITCGEYPPGGRVYAVDALMQRKTTQFWSHPQQFWVLDGEKDYQAALVTVPHPIHERAAEGALGIVCDQQVRSHAQPVATTALNSAASSLAQTAGTLIPAGGVSALV